MEDSEIISLYWNRSEDAIRETDKKYGKLCRRIALNFLFDNEDAEECVNDTYLGVWNAIPTAKPQIFSAYICRITRNLSLKKYEYIHARKRNSTAAIPLEEIEECISDNGESEYEDAALSDCINRFLDSISPDCRNVFIRRYWFFDSVREIALRYRISESKVETMLFRTRNKLRVFLQKEGFEE